MLGQIPTSIQLPAVNNNVFGPAIPLVGLTILYHVVVFAVAYRILTRIDFDTQSKILWLLVVVFVPLGFVLYWGVAPRVPPPPVGSPRRSIPSSDVSGTPWAGNSGYTKQP